MGSWLHTHRSVERYRYLPGYTCTWREGSSIGTDTRFTTRHTVVAILQQQRYSFISRSNRETRFQIRHIVQPYVCQSIDQSLLEHMYVDTKHYETYGTLNALTLDPTPLILAFSTKPTTTNPSLPNF